MGKSLSKLIGEVAVIASVQTRSLGMTRLDKQASKESDQRHNALEGTMRGSLSRMPGCDGAIKSIGKLQRTARQMLITRTTQWRTDRRLLMNIYIGDFCGEFDVIKRDFAKEVQALNDMADELIARAKRNLGDYAIDPPSKEEIAHAFSLDYELTPVPDTDAYSASDKELEAFMRIRFEEETQQAFNGAQRDMFERLAEPLERIVERMHAYDEREEALAKGFDVDKSGTFKSTVITNITKVGKMVRAMNVTADPAIEAVAAKLDVFEQLDHETLTKHADLRKEVARHAADIRKSLAPWLE